MSATPLAARIPELSRLLDGTAITVLTLSEAGETVTLRRDAAPGPVRDQAAPVAAPVATPAPAGFAVAAPCPGIVLLAHPLRDAPLVVPGQAVGEGDVLALLRAGPLLLAVAAPRRGTVMAVEATEGALVGYGSVLVRLLPDAEEETPCPST